ncbi:MAG: chloramphenicol-sensitive protein RarD [Pseudohongiellaceae bacterium]|jgi:chloramphenicol-sensitive protein RarD
MTAPNVKQGPLLAVTAYCFWGLIPIFFKTLDAAGPGEILSHRIIWSVMILVVLLKILGKFDDFLATLKSVRRLAPLALSAFLISVNWLVFIWAINSERVLETSLGYYINPLVSVFLATVVLKESLNRLQLLAIGIAALGVLNQLLMFGQAPWVALTLAFSFGGYGLVRKKIDVDPFVGLTVETLILMPIAIGYLIALQSSGEGIFLKLNIRLDILLILSGAVTAFPLIVFAAAAKRLTLTALGLFQYIAPSVSFLLAVLLYDEDFGATEIVTFTLIWLALAIFCIDSLNAYKKKRA